MNLVHVTVTVQDIIWDELLISQDNILFITFNSLNSKGELQEGIKADELIVSDNKATALISSCINKNQIYGSEITKNVKKLSISSFEEGGIVTLRKLELRKPKCVQKLYINGYLLSLFVKTLQQSALYRRSVITNFKECLKKKGKMSQRNGIMEFRMKLVFPHKQVIDFAWSERLERLVMERRELENAMSWLSTLGGAFSALGEEIVHCAEIAGRISVQQFRIALRLGDPMTVARCKLYLALSLVQTGHLASARCIVEQQYLLACSAPVLDTRLISMCLGIWAKLKYDYHKRRKENERRDKITTSKFCQHYL
jgi:hypothetical protein